VERRGRLRRRPFGRQRLDAQPEGNLEQGCSINDVLYMCIFSTCYHEQLYCKDLEQL
jgi:hypothetical protein